MTFITSTRIAPRPEGHKIECSGGVDDDCSSPVKNVDSWCFKLRRFL